MDIVDIILARAKSFTGETATLTRQAQQAMTDANDIVDRLEAIEADTQAANTTANEAAATATAAAEQLTGMKEDIEAAAASLVEEAMGTTSEDIAALQQRTTTLENQIQNAGGTITFTDNDTSAAKVKQANVTKNGATNTYVVEKNYTTYGANEDGSMTQKAITNYVSDVKANLENQIRTSGGSGGGSTNLGGDNAGSVVVVGPDGNIIAGDTSEQSIIEALIRTGVYHAKDAVGATIDYENKSISRSQEATADTNFGDYIMYDGRKRCNVSDDGRITAFYGDANYKDDGSNGQVMVYQPKFYYQRIPINTTNAALGKIIRKESLIISPTAQSGFKLHPAFIDENGNELEYILISAYEGSVYDTSAAAYIQEDNAGVDFATDKLSSVAGAKPLSGEHNTLTVTSAEKLANNRGEGWHITNTKVCSLDQMLALVEYGTFNIQNALESGVSYLENIYTYNRACYTGSTAALGNASGAATTSTNKVNGVTNNYGENGKRSISYRGEENPYGNIWKFIADMNVSGDGTVGGGIPYICKNYNYASTITDDYESVGMVLPNRSDWISGMGYGDEKYDWLFIPAEATNANSATPVGDYVWIIQNLNQVASAAFGGDWLFTTKNGMFFYAFDRDMNYSAATFGARLVYMPKKNSIHDSNYALWRSKIGG